VTGGLKAAPTLSVVIPAYNEERRLPRTLTETLSYFHRQPYTSEILVVDDGSRDQTAAIVRTFQRESDSVQLVHSDVNHGKGHSVRRGVLHARGDYILFMDADLATSLDAVVPLLAELTEDRADVVIGSRRLARSKVTTSLPRKLLSWGFSWSRRLLTDVHFEDTQCGFKGFRGAAARAIFSEQRLRGWTFDVELLMLAERQGWRVTELPVAWEDVEGSKIGSFTPARMLLELIRLRTDFRRRKHQRLPTALAVTLHQPSGEPEMLFARNLSVGGIFIMTAQPPRAGARVTVSISLPSGDLLSLDAEVAHARPGSGGAGLQFVELGGHQRRALELLLERIG